MTLITRLNKGWPVERCFTQAVRKSGAPARQLNRVIKSTTKTCVFAWFDRDREADQAVAVMKSLSGYVRAGKMVEL